MPTDLTIHDIARLAGVSKTTVSRVLNQNVNVNAATRERVLRVIEERRFVPSLNAKGLKGQSQLIGLLMPMLKWTAFLEVIWSIATYVSEQTNYGIMLYTCPPDKDYREVVDRIFSTKMVAGLLTMLYDQSPDHFVSLYHEGVPIVLIDPISLQADLPWVGVDHRTGAYTAVRHLIQQGHTRIGYIQGPPYYPCSHQRYQGYCDALREAGISPAPELVQQAMHSLESGTVAAKTLLALAEPPTALFAFSDGLAYGAIAAASELGLRVPQDLAVVGFNDDLSFDYQRPILTTVHQPFAEMGQCALELLLSLVKSQNVMSDRWLPFAVEPSTTRKSTDVETQQERPLHFQLSTQLIVRESSTISTEE